MSKLTKNTELNEELDMLDIMDKEVSNYEELQFRNLENTPFTIVRQGKEWYGVIGNHRVTEAYEKEEELILELTEITWDRLIQVIWAVVEKFKTTDKIKENE